MAKKYKYTVIITKEYDEEIHNIPYDFKTLEEAKAFSETSDSKSIKIYDDAENVVHEINKT
jgi:hypothetical protein